MCLLTFDKSASHRHNLDAHGDRRRHTDGSYAEYLQLPRETPVGTASVIGLIIAVPGTVGYIISGWGRAGLPAFSLGYVNLGELIAIVVTSMWFAPLGARTAHSIEPRILRILFGAFLTVTATKMLFDSYRMFF